MTDQAKLLALEDVMEIIKNHFETNEFNLLQYEETPTFAPYASVKILVSIDNIQHEVRFLVKKITKEIPFHDIQKLDFAPNYHFLKNNSLIVFEDENYGQPTSLDLVHIKLTLKTLAQFHAGSIGFGPKPQIIDGYPSEVLLENSWFKQSLNPLNALIDLYPKNALTHEDFKSKIMGVYEDSLRVMGTHQFRRALCHGLVWNKNLLFKYDGTVPLECKLINFELVQYQPPGLDVLQCIYLSTTNEMRQHHFHDLLELYYGCLKSELENIDELLPWKEDFEASLHQFLPLIKCLKVKEYLSTELGQGDSSPLAAKLYHSDNKFKKIIMEAIAELEDLVAHPNLTKEDCFKIIKNKLGTTNYELLSYQVIPLGTISGFLGDHNKLKIEVSLKNQKKTLNLFAKLYPKTDSAIRLATDTNAFFKETFFYESYMTNLRNFGVDIINDCVVPCYFTRHNNVIIFEDFNAVNYATLDSRKPFGIEIMRIVIEKMAKLHASSIILEEKLSEEAKSPYRFGDHFPVELKEALFTLEANHQGGRCMLTGIEAVEHELNLFPDSDSAISDAELKMKIKKAYERVFELVKPSKEFRNVICHGDLWVSNILVQILDGKPSDCRFIDFQITRYCPPAQDLLTFLYLTTNRATRRKHSSELINLYHEELAKNLQLYGYDIEDVYPYETFMKSVEYMRPQAVCQTVLYFQLVLLTSDFLKDVVGDEEAYKKILLVDRRSCITNAAKKDPLYVQRALESLQDLREMCLKYF